MARLHGRNGIVYLGQTFGADASPVAFLSDWSINFLLNRIEVTAKTEDQLRWFSGKTDVTGDFSGFYDDATSQTYEQAIDTLPRRFYLYPNVAQKNRYFGGLIVADFAVTGSVGAATAIKSTWGAASVVAEYNTDFIINASAAITGQGGCGVIGGITSILQGQGVIGATPTIRPPPVQLIGAGTAGAIPGTGILTGAGVMPAVTPVITDPRPTLTGRGTVICQPIISVTSDPAFFFGQGQIVIPGKNQLILAGNGMCGDNGFGGGVPIIGVKASIAGAGVASAAPTQAIGATAAIAGLGVCGCVPQIVYPPFAVAAAPGQTWKRMFHRQRQRPPPGMVAQGVPLTLTVTATQGGTTSSGMVLRVMVLTQALAKASQPGATISVQKAGTTAFTNSITTTQTGSRVYGASSHGPTGPTSDTANGSSTIIDQIDDHGVNNERYLTFKETSLSGSPGAVILGFTSATSDTGPFVMLEVLTAGTLTEDGSGPAAVSTTGAGGTTVTTASFTAPSSSLLVALVGSDGGSGVTTMTVSGGSLIWTESVKNNPSGGDYAGIWLAQVP